MNRKKYLLGSILSLCGLLTACSFNPFGPQIKDNTSEVMDGVTADGFIALNNNDKEDTVVATSKDGRFSFSTNKVNGVTLVADHSELSGELIIPETIDGHRVTKIGRSAYANSAITKVVIPDGVKIIEDRAFFGCESLVEVVVGADAVEIGENAFMNCYNLAKVALNEKMYRLGHSAFSSCYRLTNITLPDSIELIDKYCFTNSGLTEIKLPAKLYYVAEGTFMGCVDMKDVEIPESLAIIDHLAFADCPNIQVVIGETCGQVCSTAFQGSANVDINPSAIFEPQTLTYEGDFSEFENPQVVKQFYSYNETESANDE